MAKKNFDKLDEIVFRWLEGGTENKRRRYWCVWNQWREWLRRRKIKKPGPLDCQKFTNHYSTGRAPKTIHSMIAALRSTYAYLLAVEALDKNIWLGGRFYFPGRQLALVRPTATILDSQVRAILQNQDKSLHADNIRDRALFYLAFAAGLRRSDAIKLNLSDIVVMSGDDARDVRKVMHKDDIDVEVDEILVVVLRHTKSGKEDLKPVAHWAISRILDLVSQRMLEGADGESPVFVTWYAGGFQRISASTYFRVFRDGCAEVGVKAAPHAARAAYATNLLRRGVPKPDVAWALGHGDDQSVHIYDKRVRKISDNRGVEVNFEELKKTS